VRISVIGLWRGRNLILKSFETTTSSLEFNPIAYGGPLAERTDFFDAISAAASLKYAGRFILFYFLVWIVNRRQHTVQYFV
jgi:hypothetical protein